MIWRTSSSSITALIAVASWSLVMNPGALPAQTPEELETLRGFIEQQQAIIEQQRAIIEQQQDEERQQAQERQAQRGRIEALERQVEALREATAETERGVLETRAALEAADRGEDLLLPPISGGPTPFDEASRELDEQTGADLPDETAPPTDDAKYKVTLGANLNRQVNVAGDGNRTKAYFVDSSNIPTNAFLKGRAKVSDDLTLGAHLEAALQDNAASRVSQTNETSGFNIDGRFFEVTADSVTYGKGSFGKGFASAFTIAEIDQSGTQYANLGSVGNTAAGLLFYSDDLDNYSGISVGDAFLDLEGLSLINRIRYDSPIWQGFRLSGTLGEDQYRDAALRYGGELGDFNVTSAATYQDNPRGPFSKWRVNGSAGILHRPTGLNLSGGVSQQEAVSDGRKSQGFLIRGGLRRKWFDFGETKTSIDFTRTTDITTNGDRADSIGAFVVQDIDDYGLQLYTGYRTYNLDGTGLGLDPIHVWTVGTAVNFDVDFSFDQE